MVGKRKTPGQPCSSDAPLNALWPPISSAKTRRLPCFRNGSSIRIRSSNTRMAIPGIACSNKAFNCSTASARRIAFAFVNRSATCRSSLCGRFPGRTNSWTTGISEVAQVVFVRKRLVEIQYLHTTITDEQRREFAQLVEATIRQIESAQFLPHSGIRFPQNPCSSCPYIGLCLGRQELVEAALIRRPGAESLDWLDELHY